MSDSFLDIAYAPSPTSHLEKASMIENKLGSPITIGWEDRLAEYLAFKKELADRSAKIAKLGPTLIRHEENVNLLKSEVKDFTSGAPIADLKNKFTTIAGAMTDDAEKLGKYGESARYLSTIYDMLAEIEGKYGDQRLADQQTKSRAFWQQMLDAAANYPSRKSGLTNLIPIYRASLKPDFDAREAYEEQLARDKVQQAFNKTVGNLKTGIGHSIVAPEKASFAKKPRPPGAAY